MNSKQHTVELFRGRLEEIIAKSGLTRSAFSRRVGIDRSTLSQILSTSTARLPRVETLVAIATSEHVSVDWLIGVSQVGSLQADILRQEVDIAPGGLGPVDARLESWHADAAGYKIRHVPATLPDLLKTPEVIEYRGFKIVTNSLEIDWYWYSDDAPEPNGCACNVEQAKRQIDGIYAEWKEDPLRYLSHEFERVTA